MKRFADVVLKSSDERRKFYLSLILSTVRFQTMVSRKHCEVTHRMRME